MIGDSGRTFLMSVEDQLELITEIPDRSVVTDKKHELPHKEELH